MNVSRPKAILLGLAVVGALVAGCQPTSPAADGTSAPVATTDATTDPALADAAADPTTVEPSATTAPTTRPPATTAAKPATTKKPAAKPTTHKPAPKPKPTTKKPTPKPTTKPPAAGAVHPGAFCSPEGATGHTSKGTSMRCTRKAGEKQARWRAAA
jgi:outer membrane biosynthesis protein TonB